jgi:hypothetical protein
MFKGMDRSIQWIDRYYRLWQYVSCRVINWPITPVHPRVPKANGHNTPNINKLSTSREPPYQEHHLYCYGVFYYMDIGPFSVKWT